LNLINSITSHILFSKIPSTLILFYEEILKHVEDITLVLDKKCKIINIETETYEEGITIA
jgi:hypothetical protein